ncbi:hypothetical protein F5884DRAFT_650479, partial [Xylogone sp. PMI_703]
TISSELIDCLRQFDKVVDLDALKSRDAEIPLYSWADELGRLRVWAANIGAHQSGQSSLDYRLRDASHIRDQTIKLLRRLRRAFDDLKDVLEDVDIEPNADDEELDDDDGTEVQQIYCGIVETITGLFQLSIAIRQPAQHDRLLGTKRADATPFVPFDREHVSNKFPNALESVIDRLGLAISRRRAAIKYRERHHTKLGKGIDHATNDQQDGTSTKISETIATEYKEPYKDLEDTESITSGMSQTSYAQSLFAGTDSITVPPRPKTSMDGNAFECPYCYFIVTVRDQRSWTRHVFQDLMPYICVFPDCSTPNKLYSSRHEWYRHLEREHLSQLPPDQRFQCPLGCGTVPSLQQHLGRHLEEVALFALPLANADDDD